MMEKKLDWKETVVLTDINISYFFEFYKTMWTQLGLS